MQIEAKRLVHNRKIMEQFLAEKGIACSVPPVNEQLESHVVSGIPLNAYNPSIAIDNERIVMVYRFHTSKNMRSELGMCELAPDFKVNGNRVISVSKDSCEDPRLIWHQDKLLCAYVKSNVPSRELKSNVQLLEIESGMEKTLKSPNDRPLEKNWIPFIHNDELLFIYEQHPELVVIDQESKVRHTTKSFRWKWGFPKGGTSPIEFNGNMLRFFHSTLDNEMRPWFRRYYIGAVVTKSYPPFEIVTYSRKPILQGCEIGGDATSHMFKGNVVFPGGAIAHKGGFLMAVGVNDCECQLVKVEEKNLNL